MIWDSAFNILTNPAVSAFISVFSCFVTIIAFYFTYITYISPISRFEKLLRDSTHWRKVLGSRLGVDQYRHRKFSQYSIEVDFNETVADSFFEDWMDELPILDMHHNSSHYVRLYSGGSLMDSELFVSCDGGRYFIPAPRKKFVEKTVIYSIDSRQLLIARIVGKLYLSDSLEGFLKESRSIAVENRLSFLRKLTGKILRYSHPFR